jgi:hypothetical protein
MDLITGRPDHIEDFLAQLNTGGWFGWSDSKNKIYANLIIHPKIWDSSYEGNIHEEGMINNPYSKPTEQECVDGLAQLQADFDSKDYARNRQEEYPSIRECVHAILDDDLENLQILRQAVKEKYPK